MLRCSPFRGSRLRPCAWAAKERRKGTLETSSAETTDSGRRRLRQKFAVDLELWTAAALLAFPLRLPRGWVAEWRTMLLYAVVTLPIQAVLIATFRLHHQAWGQVSLRDALRLTWAVAIGTGLTFAIGLVWYAVAGFPRTVPLIEGALALLALGGVRAFVRTRSERDRVGDDTPRGVLLVGAGEAGVDMARQLHNRSGTGMSLVGYLDDDPLKQRLTIAGYRVLGRVDDLPHVVAKHAIDEVLIAMPSAPGRVTRRIVEMARQAGVPCRTLPSFAAIISGDVRLSMLREVRVEDLLRRDPVELDLEGMSGYLQDRVVLVTGAGGSIGSELVRQVAAFRPARIVLLGHGENSLHDTQLELRHEAPELDAPVMLASITDRIAMQDVMNRYRPDVVFHAAAHKHVPLLEANPDAAVANNVGGTLTVARAALEAGVPRLVNISTDKAVRPASMLGVTKALAERVIRALAEEAGDNQTYVSVRFGNVLGSRGSVVPLFTEQIRHGGPVTVTDRDTSRYFMTIPEAARLVIQAGAFGQNGATYVLDMGEPVRIMDLATDMIRLSGADPEDVGIELTGLRPGEKLTEVLFTVDESLGPTAIEPILWARAERRSEPGFLEGVERLVEAAERRDIQRMDRILRELEPGFRMSVPDGTGSARSRYP